MPDNSGANPSTDDPETTERPKTEKIIEDWFESVNLSLVKNQTDRRLVRSGVAK